MKELQQQLFQSVKLKLPPEASMPDEIGRLLEISTDSAYRRLRGEKAITFEELYKIGKHYNISVDQLMNIGTDGFLFQGSLVNQKSHRFDSYLKSISDNLGYFSRFDKKEICFLSKDALIFHHFNTPELAAFKYHFWMRTLLFFPEFKNKQVSIEEYPEDLIAAGQKIIRLYNRIDSIEVWNIESWNGIFHQVEYYLSNGMFQSGKDALRVYDAIKKTIRHLEEQARLGYKFDVDDPQKTPLAKFSMFLNETVLLDNSMMIQLDGKKMVAILHTAINYMLSRDNEFCEHYYFYIQNMLQRSTQISKVSEKERTSFFRRIYERLDKRIENLQKDNNIFQ